MKQTRLPRLASVDACRGAAALSVLFFHVLIWLLWPGEDMSIFGGKLASHLSNHGRLENAGSLTFGLGFLGVQLFFVISGFCIHAAYVNTAKLDRVHYFIRRMVRIYPLYLLVVVGLFLLYGMVHGIGGGSGVTLKNFVGHLFFWLYEGPVASEGRGISEVLWTIALEVQFYILYAICGFRLIKRFGAARVALIWLGADIAYRLFWYTKGEGMGLPLACSPERLALTRFGEWLLGAWLAEQVYRRGEGRNFAEAGRRPAVELALGVVVIIAGILVGGMAQFEGDIMDVPGAIGFFLIVRALVRSEMRGTLWREAVHHGLCFLGDRCYTLYLTHLTVISICAGVLQRLATRLDWVTWPEFGVVSILAAVLATVAAIGVSVPLYRFVELPSHQLARRLCPRRSLAVKPAEFVDGKTA